MYWSCGPRGVVAGARRRSLSGEDGPACTTPAPVFVRHSDALTRVETCGWASIAATTWAAVLDRSVRVGRRVDADPVAGQGDAQRLVGRARGRGVDLGREAV